MKSITERCTPAVFLIMSESLGIIQISPFVSLFPSDPVLIQRKLKPCLIFYIFEANVSLGKL